MKKYNWLLWGVAAFVVVRYLKKKNQGAAATSIPEALQPLAPAVPYGKPGTVVNNIVPEAQAAPIAPQSKMAPQAVPMPEQIKMQVKKSIPVPPSESFKPGKL